MTFTTYNDMELKLDSRTVVKEEVVHLSILSIF